jgi:hypothetical protein
MVQAKDISKQEILDTIRKLGYLTATTHNCRWVMIWDIHKELSQYPKKVVTAKLRNMVNKGLIHGCCCGCRGDFYIDGEEYND